MRGKITFLLSALLIFASCQVENVENDLENSNLLDADKRKNKPKTASISNDDNCAEAIGDLVASLPETVSLTTTAKPADASYFLIDIHDTNLAGSGIEAWCVDVDLSLGVEGPLTFDVYSSYETLPDGKFENPENFDLVNWILNQSYVGTTSPNGGTYTFGHVQWAIWELIDDRNCRTCTYLTNPLGDWRTNEDDNIRLGQEIVDAAIANGEGYMPGCGELYGIVLIPEGKQSIIITKRVPGKELGGCETAFAKGANSTCFIEDGFNRWGWTIGPLTEGNYTYDVYAAAGQCDTSKGALVGTVDVSYADGDVTVTYNIDEAYTLTETHSYAGNNPYPVKGNKETVAPGQFKIEENLSGEIYVIAHAVVCGD